MRILIILGTLLCSFSIFAETKESTSLGDFTLRQYGFIKAAVAYSDAGVQSGPVSDGFRSPTEAANQEGDSVAEETQSSIQSAQTRWGFKVSNNQNLTGTFEFDAAGAQGSPDTDASRIRIRQINIRYNFNPSGTVFIGQKWKTFAGINPHNTNFVGNGFRAGNSGFIGHEVGVSYQWNPLTLTLALGNKGNNSSTATTDTELGIPAQNIRLDYKQGAHHFGAAYINAELEQSSLASGNVDSNANGYKVFYRGVFGAVDFRAEYYAGNNLNDLGLVTLASSSATDDVERGEIGYFVSAKYSMENMSFWAAYGRAEVDELSEFSDGNLVGNTKINAGVDFQLMPQLVTFLSWENFNSSYLNSSNEEVDSEANEIELGLIYRFKGL